MTDSTYSKRKLVLRVVYYLWFVLALLAWYRWTLDQIKVYNSVTESRYFKNVFVFRESISNRTFTDTLLVSRGSNTLVVSDCYFSNAVMWIQNYSNETNCIYIEGCTFENTFEMVDPVYK